MLCAVLGCTPSTDPTDGPTDGPTDDTDVTEAAPCDYGDFAGNWAGTVVQDDGSEYTMEATLLAAAELDQPVGTSRYNVGARGCGGDFICLDRPQNEWHVVHDLITDGLDQCFNGYVRLQQLDADTLSYAWRETEFGADRAWATLTRME